MLKDLKEGDTVVLKDHRGFEALTTIKRVTKTQIILGSDCESKYRRKTGREIGCEGYHLSYIRIATKEVREKLRLSSRHKAFLSEVRNTVWESLSTEKLKAVLALLEDGNDAT